VRRHPCAAHPLAGYDDPFSVRAVGRSGRVCIGTCRGRVCVNGRGDHVVGLAQGTTDDGAEQKAPYEGSGRVAASVVSRVAKRRVTHR
jgi:hypothetical protein